MATIDATHCISLDRRPDRWARFVANVPTTWTFPQPQKFSAYDGREVLVIPPNWKATPGAFGCLLSHRVLLREAVEKRQTILIFEDDVIFRPAFCEKLSSILATAPPFDLLFLGGQHVVPSLPCEYTGLRKCRKTQRTHAYIVSPEGADVLLPIAERADTHIDVLYARAMDLKAIVAYAVASWLCGQTGGESDIFGANQRGRTEENYWDEVPQ